MNGMASPVRFPLMRPGVMRPLCEMTISSKAERQPGSDSLHIMRLFSAESRSSWRLDMCLSCVAFVIGLCLGIRLCSWYATHILCGRSMWPHIVFDQGLDGGGTDRVIYDARSHHEVEECIEVMQKRVSVHPELAKILVICDKRHVQLF